MLLRSCARLGDQAELWTKLWGCARARHVQGERVETPIVWGIHAVVTLWKGKKIAVCEGADLSIDAWAHRFKGSAFELSSVTPQDGPPQARLPGPMTFDPDLVDNLSQEQTLYRLGGAFSENLRHEGERIDGLQHFSSELALHVEQYLVGRNQSIAGSIHGALAAQFEINSVYGDRLLQVHAPDSFLPFALLGARTWRNMPSRILAGGPGGRKGRAPVLLHPRALESILRAFGPRQLCSEGELEHPLFGGQLTLADDPLTDGIFRSRGFDDLGEKASRTPLFVRGQPISAKPRSIFSSKSDPRLGSWSAAALGGQPKHRPAQDFSCLVAERGHWSFNDLASAHPSTLMVSAVGPIVMTDASTGSFVADVRWGMRLSNGQSNAIVAPGTWKFSGALRPTTTGMGIFDEAKLSRELNDTGSSILPYCLINADLEYRGV